MGVKGKSVLDYWKYFLRIWKSRTTYIQWTLLFSFEENSAPPYSFSKLRRMVPPKDRIWADPFVIFKNNKYYLFVEELKFKKNKGCIAVIELTKEGEHSKSKVVLEKDYHLSYPFLFEEGENLYMIPETAHKNTIELYKCVDFPTKWEFQEYLMENIKTADTTLFKHDGRYWMFTNTKEVEGSENWDILNLYFSENLLNGNWQSHPLNPVVKNIKSSRPAGAVFRQNGRIFRPGQNCSKHYGYGITISEIIKLSTSQYEEREVQSIEPDWAPDLVSTHTINFASNLIVADALIRRRKWFWQ
jgi:hypothetical protein